MKLEEIYNACIELGFSIEKYNRVNKRTDEWIFKMKRYSITVFEYDDEEYLNFNLSYDYEEVLKMRIFNSMTIQQLKTILLIYIKYEV